VINRFLRVVTLLPFFLLLSAIRSLFFLFLPLTFLFLPLTFLFLDFVVWGGSRGDRGGVPFPWFARCLSVSFCDWRVTCIFIIKMYTKKELPKKKIHKKTKTKTKKKKKKKKKKGNSQRSKKKEKVRPLPWFVRG
jgi:hypothetical protein